MSFEYATAIDRGTRKRERGGINEDSISAVIIEGGHQDVTQSLGAFVLADGAGGEDAGEVASHLAARVVGRELSDLLWEACYPREFDSPASEGEPDIQGETILNAITRAIQEAHRRILETVSDLDLGGAYTTIVVGVKAADRMYYAWVGDSRAYVINTHPECPRSESISALTRDHSLVRRLVDRGSIDEVEAHVHRQGNRVTRALGGTPEDEPGASQIQVDTGEIRLHGDDIVLLTSDGLIDAYADAPRLHDEYRKATDPTHVEEKILRHAVTDDEIRDVVLNAGCLDEAATALVSLANDRGGKDNISIILYRDGELPSSPAQRYGDRNEEADVSPANATTALRRDDD